MQITSNTLVNMASGGRKLITLEVDLETLAGFSAAVEVFGTKSYAGILHPYVVQKIREAKSLVSKEEFEKLVQKKTNEIQERSKIKSLERKKGAPVISASADMPLPRKKKVA